LLFAALSVFEQLIRRLIAVENAKMLLLSWLAA